MEEILASIRQIISEDGDGSSGTKDATNSAAPEPPADPPQSQPAPYQTVVSRLDAGSASGPTTPTPSPLPAPAQELARPLGTPLQAEPAARNSSSASSLHSASPPAQPTPLPKRPARHEDESTLLSPEKRAVVSGAFGALTQTLLAQNSRTLEDVVAEMLQPMLKSWLDDNLPSLVERMVQEEIERVSRGRR